MKKGIIFIVFIVSTISSFAQELRTITNPEVIQGVLIKITKPLSEFKPDSNWVNEPVRDENGVINRDTNNVEHRNGGHPANDPTALPKGKDPVLQSTMLAQKKRSSSIGVNFNGQGNTGVSPADPSLCVGPNHIIQMINGSSGALFAIYNKTGGVVLAAQYMDAISGIPGLGDPIAIYDQFADRFVITEFSATNNKLIVMISQTNSPLGSWYVYQFTAPEFPDYPKWGIWPNAFICTTNETNNKVYAMDRATMITGAATTTMIAFSITASPTIGFQAAAPVNISGTTLPPTGTNPMIFRMVDDAWTTSTTDVDRLELWTMNLDFAVPANSTLNQQPDINTAAFTSDLCGYTTLNCIRQPGTNTRMDPIRELLMNRVYYRNFNTYQSVVLVHSVDPGTLDQAGVRWYELRRTGLGAWSIYQQSTFAPDTNSRWMPTVAINKNGNIGMVYNVSSKAVYPSLRFTGRLNSASLNTMAEPEQTIIAGTAANTSNRWGDYNDMQIDPSDDETFWTTGMYRPSGGWATRVASFTITQFPLPLSLVTFEGKKINDQHIQLHWIAENEISFYGYEIERQEDNGDFTKIAFVPAQATGKSSNNYLFEDTKFNAVANKNYRLKMIDIDGKYRYSNTVFIEGNQTKNIEIYPNPVLYNEVYIRLKNELYLKNLHISIYNQQGQCVQTIEANNQQQVVAIAINNLPKNNYLITVSDAQGNLLAKEMITKN